MDISIDDPRVLDLQGDRRDEWDVDQQCICSSVTAYVPFGCGDWGETRGVRNDRCLFCGLPQAAKLFRIKHYGGGKIPVGDYVPMFKATLKAMVANGEFHTLKIFNAGSYLAMPHEVKYGIASEIGNYPFIRRVVIESRAPLIKKEPLAPLMDIFSRANQRVTIRVGIETQDDNLRLNVLKKGHTREELGKAVAVMRELGVTSGAYCLLNPFPGLTSSWAVEEAIRTIHWILGSREGDLGMDEVYFEPTCVNEGSKLFSYWEKGEFFPASLWDICDVLQATLSVKEHRGRVQLVPSHDQPPFVAVPSNHVRKGIPESLEGAQGCDLEVYAMFARYRETMDHSVLYRVKCSCRPF